MEAPVLEPGRNCWRIERADRAALLVDAADYFRIARLAMLRARSRILLIGWDFDTRICLDYEADDGAPAELGAFLAWLPKKNPDLQIHILKWDVGALKLLGRGTTVLRLLRWAADDQIHFKLDGAHPTGGSHHQKIAVIDDALAFCGGIDMTADRWDTRAHRPRDSHRKRPTTRRRYPPWHDASMAVDGAAARALGALARKRWETAGGDPIPPAAGGSDPWPEQLRPDFEGVDVAVARTRGGFGEVREVREIEALYCDMIARAQRFIYFENQYFTSRRVAEAIIKRLREPNGPEFVMLNPRNLEGWLEEKAMDPARAELLRVVAEADAHVRFRLYTPVNAAGEDIYVHSKITVVDDRLLRVGSANLNNRSMGLDSECDLLIDADRAEQGAAQVSERIAAIRTGLIGEHLGCEPKEVAALHRDSGSLIRAIEGLRGPGRSLCPYEPPEPSAATKKLARAELLDPESSGEVFEPVARPGLLSGIRTRLPRLSGGAVPQGA
jgi:phospholipase D1/2